MSFAFNNANELPMPLDNRTNDVSAGLEYVQPAGMIRVGWDASWFDNNIKSIVWDNPLRATDTTPFDASGYSNGNGPASGRMSMPPSNTHEHGQHHGPLQAAVAHDDQRHRLVHRDEPERRAHPVDDQRGDRQPDGLRDVPGLAALPRDTAEARVHGVNAMFNFTSRPNSFFGLTMRYRFNDHKNLTPEFDATQYVRFDAVPENTGGVDRAVQHPREHVRPDGHVQRRCRTRRSRSATSTTTSTAPAARSATCATTRSARRSTRSATSR